MNGKQNKCKVNKNYQVIMESLVKESGVCMSADNNIQIRHFLCQNLIFGFFRI